jgi:xanthine dehydrogenase YagS FAD-binding subunit
MMPSFSYVRPTSLPEAVRHLDGEGSRIHAGGTDLLGCLWDRVFEARTVVSLSGLDELRGIQETRNGGLRIGAMASVAEAAASPIIKQRYRALAAAAAEVASPQLRNQGTIGGNICQKPRCVYYRGEFHCLRKGGDTCFAAEGENEAHCIFGGDGCYIVHPSDTATALAALAAEIRIRGPGGSRSVAIEDFHVPPGVDPERETVLEAAEIVTEIQLPAPAPGLRSSYRKVRARGAWDFALAGVALALELDGDTVKRARVVLSGAAPIPWRARAAENAIEGRPLDSETAARAGEAAIEGAEPLARNGYKVPLIRALVEEELLAIA